MFVSKLPNEIETSLATKKDRLKNRTTKKLLKVNRSGASLSDREGIRLKYSDLRINTYAARSMLYRTVELLGKSENAINEVLTEGYRTTDLMSSGIGIEVGCSKMGELIAEKLK